MRHAKTKPASKVHLTPYLRGVVYGLFLAGCTLLEISEEVVKPDGSHPSMSSISDCIKTAESSGGICWDGNTCPPTGRARTWKPALDKAIVKLVFKMRGSTIVTAKYVRKTLKIARTVPLRTLQRRLQEAGFAWLRRRRKSLVSPVHRAARLEWAAWVLSRTAVTLARWAYTDGTTFFLARCQGELGDKKRLSLGAYVYRMASGSDGLYEDCLGPSSYAKAQGTPVRVWGLLVAGTLFIYVLEENTVMNRWIYQWVVQNKFPIWLGKALGRKASAFLVQDHERCLWTEEACQAIRSQGIKLLEKYPKCSQDLNPIETAWRELRNRLATTEPARLEGRSEFIRRLRQAVAWVNRNRPEYLKTLCSSQKAWARDVQNAVPPGSRTKH
jgi:hypothetical protein